MAEQRTIRDMLMTYGHNEGRRMTDKEYVEFLVTNFKADLPKPELKELAERLHSIAYGIPGGDA